MMLINKVLIYTRSWAGGSGVCGGGSTHELGTHVGLAFCRKLLNLTKKSPFVFFNFFFFLKLR